MHMPSRGLSNNRYGGSKWISRQKRLALYLRDGLACVWCGVGVEDGAALSLDHLTPHSQGGTNEATNLVTACARCNSSRGERSVEAFAEAVAQYLNHGVQAAAIVTHIETTRQRPYNTKAALELIQRRGGWSQVFTQ
jgi:hypothetical protein